MRPAIVECADRYPFPGWNEGINTSGPLVWLMSTAFRRLPVRRHVSFDIIPVDMVCRGTMLAVAEALGDEASPVYQLGTSHRNRLDFERALELSNLAIRKRHRASENAFERYVLSALPAFSADPDEDYVLGVAQTKRLVEEARDALKRFDVDADLPPKWTEKRGALLKKKKREWWSNARNNARKLKAIEDMLRQFRPFIWDHNYRYHADAACDATARLPAAEREVFGFDVEALDWRRYYMDVQVPGLERWCIPLLRGEKVAEDPAENVLPHREALPDRTSESGEHRAARARLSA